MIHSLQGPAKKLVAYIGQDEMYDDRPLFQALVDQARTQGCAGATVSAGTLGFGPTSRDVTKHALRMSTDLPLVITVIDELQRITALAEVWSSMVKSGLITVEDCSVVYYATPEE